MYKYVLNSVVKISMMFAKYFKYYTIILRGGIFSWTRCIIIADLHSRCGHYIFVLFLLFSFFFSLPNLSGRRLDVYLTSTHGVALVRI